MIPEEDQFVSKECNKIFAKTNISVRGQVLRAIA